MYLRVQLQDTQQLQIQRNRYKVRNTKRERTHWKCISNHFTHYPGKSFYAWPVSSANIFMSCISV